MEKCFLLPLEGKREEKEHKTGKMNRKISRNYVDLNSNVEGTRLNINEFYAAVKV